MRIVINDCFGGFSLSPRAVKRLAELDGRKCYFFSHEHENRVNIEKHYPISIEKAETGFMFSAFDIPNPDELLRNEKNWYEMTDAERTEQNKIHTDHALTARPSDRTNPKLIQVVEELGSGHRTGASGRHAELKIVEIPDGVEYEINDYDGNETIHEVHRSWS